jgi:hypothetical protein
VLVVAGMLVVAVVAGMLIVAGVIVRSMLVHATPALGRRASCRETMRPQYVLPLTMKRR